MDETTDNWIMPIMRITFSMTCPTCGVILSDDVYEDVVRRMAEHQKTCRSHRGWVKTGGSSLTVRYDITDPQMSWSFEY